MVSDYPIEEELNGAHRTTPLPLPGRATILFSQNASFFEVEVSWSAVEGSSDNHTIKHTDFAISGLLRSACESAEYRIRLESSNRRDGCVMWSASAAPQLPTSDSRASTKLVLVALCTFYI